MKTRIRGTPWLCLLAVAVALGSAEAPVRPAVAQACGADTLGVGRTLTIDTAQGPRFGAQYKGGDVLEDGEVVLTFDDGPLRRHTRAILDALDKQCTKATFFMVGTMALADPEMAREVAARGHTVGSHTWSHRYQLGRLTPQRAFHEIELGASAVQLAMGQPIAPFFRFPYLSDQKASLQHLAERDIATFSIDVDSLDYRSKGPGGGDRVFQRVMKDLTERRKGIILFHDIQPATVAALPRLLAALKQKGFRVVHLTAKSPAVTIGEFDLEAQKEASRRHDVVAHAPMAPRAVTWPMSGTGNAAASGWNTTTTAHPRPAEEEKSDWAKSLFPLLGN